MLATPHSVPSYPSKPQGGPVVEKMSLLWEVLNRSTKKMVVSVIQSRNSEFIVNTIYKQA